MKNLIKCCNAGTAPIDRLYTLCERQGWAEDARAYNELITSWSAIEVADLQTELF